MESEINFLDETPRFLQVVRIIMAEIDEGNWLPHEKIPTERELCEQLGISRATIRRAIEILTDRFYLYRVQGRGTFVCPRELREFRKTSGMGFREHAINRGQVPSQEILGLEFVPVSDKIRKKLIVNGNQKKVQKLVRLFSLDDQLDSINTSYLGLPDGEAITVAELEETGSLYTLLRKKYNYVPYITCQELIAMKAEPWVASLLDIEPGYPVSYIEGVVWTLDRTVMEYVEIYRGDKTMRYQSINVGSFL